jgi:hypothetical protein
MIVIVFVPIAIRVPSPRVFIPPAMAVFPAPFARGNQLSALCRCFGAVPAVFFRGFVELVIDANDALLAVVIGSRLWRAKQQEGAGQCGSHEQRLSQERFGAMSHMRFVLR